MDWDEARAVSAEAAVLGEALHALSIADLEARVAALEAEMARVHAEIAQKRKQAAAADALFKT